MSPSSLIAFALGVALAVAVPKVAPRLQQEPPMSEEMKKMMEMGKQFTEPSEAHKKLADYVGTWSCDWKMSMGTGLAPVGTSKAVTSWLVPGKFIKTEIDGTMMGHPFKSFGFAGYDNFKKAYVRSIIDSQQTAILSAQGKLAQDGKTLIWYGTMDEYLTGENDKMVKYVVRWKDADHFIEEVHDLAIGETNTQVIELAFSRVK
jgi:hypothetical protein